MTQSAVLEMRPSVRARSNRPGVAGCAQEVVVHAYCWWACMECSHKHEAGTDDRWAPSPVPEYIGTASNNNWAAGADLLLHEVLLKQEVLVGHQAVGVGMGPLLLHVEVGRHGVQLRWQHARQPEGWQP